MLWLRPSWRHFWFLGEVFLTFWRIFQPFLLAKMLHNTGNRISLGWWLKTFSLFLDVLMYAKMSLETWHCPSASCYEGIFWYFLSSLPRKPAMSADLLCWSHCNSKLNQLGMNAWRSLFFGGKNHLRFMVLLNMHLWFTTHSTHQFSPWTVFCWYYLQKGQQQTCSFEIKCSTTLINQELWLVNLPPLKYPPPQK